MYDQSIVLKDNWNKINKIKFKMRFKVSMINDQGNCHEETIIANNEEEAKRNLLGFNPHSTVLEAKWVYK